MLSEIRNPERLAHASGSVTEPGKPEFPLSQRPGLRGEEKPGPMGSTLGRESNRKPSSLKQGPQVYG